MATAGTLNKDRKDWIVFQRLSRISKAGGQLGKTGQKELARIQAAHPEWQTSKGDRDDFPVWFETTVGDRGDAGELADISTEDLLGEMRSKVAADKLNNDGLWRRFIAAEPQRSLNALIEASDAGDWPTDEWRQFFNYLLDKDDRPLMLAAFDFVETRDVNQLGEALHPLIQWLQHQHLRLVDYLSGPERLLALWDRLSQTVQADGQTSADALDDPMFAVLNENSGMLAILLVEELIRRHGPPREQFEDDLAPRFDAILTWRGRTGLVGQIALFQRLAYIANQASAWTLEKLAPLLAPTAPAAATRWIARLFQGQAGSPALFNATAEGFWWSFDLKQEDSQEGRVVILLQAAHRKILGEPYDITPQQAKSALLREGPRALEICARYLTFGGDDPDERARNWLDRSKPLFQFVWPKDKSARTEEATQRLANLALSVESAFPDAVATLVPYLTPAWDKDWGFYFDYEEKGQELFARYPDAAVALLDALIPPDRGPIILNEMLDGIEAANAGIASDFRFQRLRALGRRLAA